MGKPPDPKTGGPCSPTRSIMSQTPGEFRVNQRAHRIPVAFMAPPGYDLQVAWQHICDLQTEITLLQRRLDALDEALKFDRPAEEL